MSSVAELNRIAASHNTLFGLTVPKPLGEGEVYNPLRRGVQRKYTLNKGKKQLYDNMVQSGKLNQDKLDKYYELVSNSNNRLSFEEKEALRPWAVNSLVFTPKPPRTKKKAPLVPHPPSYPNPRKTKVNLATYLKRVSPANLTVANNNQANPRKNKTRKMRLNLNQESVLAKNFNGNSSNSNNGNVHMPQRSNRSASTAASEPRESPVRSNMSRR
jgi:hypothetical protein